MATYYVTPTGSAANSGLTTSLPWTLAKAFLSAVAGDIVYIAPGVYRGAFTLSNSGTSGSPIQFIGDPLSTVGWVGISAGQVRITNISDDTTGTAAGATLINGSGQSWISFSKISFECIRTVTIVAIQISFGWSITQCQIVAIATNTICQVIAGSNGTGGTDMNLTFTRNVVVCNGSGIYTGMYRHSSVYGVTVNIKNCIFFGHNTSGESFGVRLFGLGTGSDAGGYNIQNCTFIGFASAVEFQTGNTSFLHSVTNSSFIGSVVALVCTSTTIVTENFNRILAQTARNGFPTGASTSVNGSVGVEYGYNEIVGLPATQMVSSILGSPNTGFGTATGALATDLFSIAWTGATPDAGAATYRNISAVGDYFPTERNASTITIAPGSTSQSIELYLGVTGLTASTSGLSAYYNRSRDVAVQITPLVALTDMTDGWVSGGFKEVNASTMPGVYRLDIPNAAVAAGADDVTVVVRGASGTNGAVMTIKLSSGGLTAAQTAAAVLDATASLHNNIGSIGASIQDKAGYSLSTPQSFSTTGSVGSVTGNVAGNVTGTVGGVAGNVTGNIAGSVATVASPDNIIDGVWDEQRTSHIASGSFGQKLQTNALADEMLARDLGSGLNLGTTEERTVRSALRAIRNKVNVGSSQMVVKKEDDTTDAWTASVTTTAVSSNVSGIDPN
jgi:hypothetical protein